LKGNHFSSDAEVIAATVTWLDGQSSEFFLSGLQNLEFGRCTSFPSWSGLGLINTPVLRYSHVSIIPPVPQTHLFIKLIFIYTLFLSEAQIRVA
jgi:hypothetical protein